MFVREMWSFTNAIRQDFQEVLGEQQVCEGDKAADLCGKLW